MLTSLATLILPLVLGVLAGRRGWLETERVAGAQAMGALNRFALLVAFPALIVAGFLDPARGLALPWPVLLLASVPLLVGVAVSWALGGRVIRTERLPARGALALVALFGNSAYLGLPLVAALVGDDALPIASVAVSVHVAMSVTLGSALLERREGSRVEPALLSRALLTSPLAMSPVVGLALAAGLEALALRDHAIALGAFRALDALGRTASPLGLFVLGLFLGQRPPRLVAPLGQLAFALVRLVVVPGATLALALALRGLTSLEPAVIRTLVTLAAVPAAISTFAMAEDAHVEPDAIARAIVTSSLLCVATIPAWLALTQACLAP